MSGACSSRNWWSAEQIRMGSSVASIAMKDQQVGLFTGEQRDDAFGQSLDDNAIAFIGQYIAHEIEERVVIIDDGDERCGHAVPRVLWGIHPRKE